MENSLFKKNSIQEGKEVIKDSKFLLSKEYKNFGWLSEKEKSDYLDLQEKAQKGDIQREVAYEYLRSLYKNKADFNFLNSVDKIHWVFNLDSLESILKNNLKIEYDISAEGYKDEPYVSSWGNGFGVKIKGDTLMASNQDLRSDNRFGKKEDGTLKKYSYGDSTSMVLKEEDFLKHSDLKWKDYKGDTHRGHNEFLLDNAEIEAIVIDITNPKLTKEVEEKVLSIASQFNLNVIYNTIDE